jgi:FO synthase subunit 1
MIAQVFMQTKNIYERDSIFIGDYLKSARTVSYSRNVFLPITNLCRNHCAYCGFRRDPDDGAWFMSPEDVIEATKKAKAAGCSEALLTLGERPDVHAEARKKLDALGYESMVDYIENLCRQILEVGLLPHTNAGLLSEQELRRLRRYNASMGLMLECVTDLPAHRNSLGKDPRRRLDVIKSAGKLEIPFTTGLLIGIGETFEDRVQSLLAIQKLHKRYGHIQEIIIQPFDPKPGTPMESRPRPSESELFATVAIARLIMPDMNIQVPPNLVSNVSPLLLAGANDLGGISSVTPDFINPEQPWPSVAELRAEIKRAGFTPRERLPIYPRYVKDERFMSEEVREHVYELADEEGYRAC